MSPTPAPKTPLPLPLKQHRGRPLLVTQLGMFGSRTLLLTDHPALYVHDTGSLLQQPRTERLEPYDTSGTGLIFAQRSTCLRGELLVGRLGKLEFDLREGLKAVAQGLPIPESKFTSLPISVTVTFDETQGTLADLMAQNAQVSPALQEHHKHGEVYAHVQVYDGRLTLLRHNAPLCDLPVFALQPTREGRRVRIRADMRIAGQPAQALTLHFPLESHAKRLETALTDSAQATLDEATHGSRASSTSAPKAIDQLDALGTLANQPITGAVDAALSPDHLTLHRQGQTHRFRFADPTLRIAGDEHTVLLLNSEHGPLRLTGGLLQRIVSSPAVRAAATGTLLSRQLPCTVDRNNQPAFIELLPDSIEIHSATIQERLPVAGVEQLTVEYQGDDPLQLCLTHEQGRFLIGGGVDALAAIHSAIQTRRLLAKNTPLESLLRNTAAHEGRYLLYTLFGPMVELHGLLCNQAQGDTAPADLGVQLQVPDSPEHRLELANTLAHGARETERQLEHAAYRLPAYLTARDGALLSPSGPAPIAIKRLEAPLALSLTLARALAGKLSAIHEPLRHALYAAGIQTPANYRSVAFNTMAGVMLNPVMLLAAANQALSVQEQSKHLAAARSDGATRAIERAVERWNQLLTVLLPPVARQTLDQVFPQRLSVIQVINSQTDHPAIRPRVVERLARLDTFLAFPGGSLPRQPRRALVEHIEHQMQALSQGEGFHPL